MAEFALAGDEGGHSWNNSLAHATFDDNVDRVGRDTALQLLREDIRSWIRERKGQSSQWSLRVQDGKMVTETGVSLQEMTDNITNGPHSDLVPESIKATAPLESATLEEATRLAVIGANRIVLPEQHLDETGNVVSRYLSVWTKNASDPTRYDGMRIDLGKNTRIEDVRTGTSFAAFEASEGVFFHQHRREKHAFVLAVQNDPERSFEAVEQSIITAVHRSHQEIYIANPRLEAYAKEETMQHKVFDERKTVIAAVASRPHDTDLFIQAPRAVVRETVETARGVAVLLHDKEKRKELVQKIRRIFRREDRLVDNQNAAALSLSTKQENERLTIEKIREKPVRIAQEIKKRHTEMRKSVAVLVVAADTKVALGAVPLVLGELAKEYKPIEAVRKSMRRHERKVRRMRKNSEKIQPLKTERVEPLRAEKERKVRIKRGRENRVKKVATAEKLTPRAVEKRRLHRVVEKSVRRRRKKELRMKNYELRRKAKREVKKDFVKGQRKEREAIAGVQFAWAAWMLLMRKNTEAPKSNFIRSDLADLQGPTLQSKEDVLWVLLSIIYYLTAIREQGMHNYPIKKKRRTLPKKGIIFSFAS